MEIFHNCKVNIFNSIQIVFTNLGEGEKSWFCRQEWRAGQQEVKNGEAEHIGELICSHSFAVKFCPFCGSELNGLEYS